MESPQTRTAEIEEIDAELKKIAERENSAVLLGEAQSRLAVAKEGQGRAQIETSQLESFLAENDRDVRTAPGLIEQVRFSAARLLLLEAAEPAPREIIQLVAFSGIMADLRYFLEVSDGWAATYRKRLAAVSKRAAAAGAIAREAGAEVNRLTKLHAAAKSAASPAVDRAVDAD